jgi:glycosyltransferase involved in cell wall biosynthesis
MLLQTFRDFELIAIDDGSTDRTGELLEVLAREDPRIRFVSRENRGLVDTLNEGVAMARGAWLARMDGDDVSHPDRLALQMAYLESRPAVGVLGTGFQIIDELGRYGRIHEMPRSFDEVRWALPLFCPLAHPTVIMKAQLVREVGGYAESTKFAEDYDLWRRMIEVASIENIPNPLLWLRKHASNVTITSRDEHIRAALSVSCSVAENFVGRAVSTEVMLCIRSWGRYESRHAQAAVRLLRQLRETLYEFESGTNRLIDRDHCMREVAILAMSPSLHAKAAGLMSIYRRIPSGCFFLSRRFFSRFLSNITHRALG